jgi:hypothetical protein
MVKTLGSSALYWGKENLALCVPVTKCCKDHKNKMELTLDDDPCLCGQGFFAAPFGAGIQAWPGQR